MFVCVYVYVCVCLCVCMCVLQDEVLHANDTADLKGGEDVIDKVSRGEGDRSGASHMTPGLCMNKCSPGYVSSVHCNTHDMTC